MYGKTAGIVGTGKDRPRTDPHPQGFGMEVLAYDIYPTRNMPHGADRNMHAGRTFTAVPTSSRCCPLTDETRYMIDGAAIGRM